MMKKLILVMVVLIMATTAVYAGGSRTSTAQPTATSSLNFTGYPMNRLNERVTWADLDGENLHMRYATAAESPFHSNYSRMTGVTIDWVFPTAGNSGDMLYTQLLAGNVRDLPYIINWGGSPEPEQLIAEGIMWDLTPYIQQWMPNYYRYLQARPERDKALKTDTGKYWSVGFFREDGPFMDTWLGPIVRKDWLDANGLPIPATLDDWDRTLQVFKDRYGAMVTFERWVGDRGGLAGAFGAYANYNFEIFYRNGRAMAANVQPEWRNYLTKMNEWYSRGLIDPDHFTMDNATFNSKALEGKIGLTFGALSHVSELINNSSAARNGADWVGIQYPRGPNNTLTAVYGGWGIIPNIGAWITRGTPADKLEIVMRVLDYAFTDEGFHFTNFGVKGDTWDYDSTGKVVWLPKFLNDIDAPDYQQVATKYVGQRGAQAGIQATRLVELINPPASFASAKTWYEPNQQQAYSWRTPPGTSLTYDESLRRQELANPIQTYVAEMAVSFITGEVPLSQFDAFVARLNQMGLAEYLSIEQAAYDRWQRR